MHSKFLQELSVELKHKTILILSQQNWGDMFLSKHHFAVELAAMGNTVYFINGPDQQAKMKSGAVEIEATAYENLFLVRHRLFYPYVLKFKAAALHQFLITFHIKKILRKINRKVDLIWSFDLSNTIPLRSFPSSVFKIFMPVDEPLQRNALMAAKNAHIIYSVTNEILEKYSAYKVPRLFINHSVSSQFLSQQVQTVRNHPVRVGLSGNMLRPDIDHATLLTIIRQHADIQFDIWGTVDPGSSNFLSLSDVEDHALAFVRELAALPNVQLHGQLSPQKLAGELQKVDAFLICYDIHKDQSRGTNYHKVLEYLATGKVVIANNITTYRMFPGLIEMTESREDNRELPELFSRIMRSLDTYNSTEQQKKRIEFARQFTYDRQIQKIEDSLRACPHSYLVS